MKKKQHKMEQTCHAEFISQLQEKDVEQQQRRFKVFNFFTSFRQKMTFIRIYNNKLMKLVKLYKA